MAAYRILSMDGGGIRGVIMAVILQRLEQAHPGFMAQFELFAGTSTGGLLALGLAGGMSPEEALDLYIEHADEVFSDSLIDDIMDLGNFTGAQYSTEPIKTVLEEHFGERTLDDLPKKVLISSFDLDNRPEDPLRIRMWKPKFFHNYPGEESDGDQSMVDVGIRTSAAPTYFPIYQGYIDGGVVANNPAVCALAQALHPRTGKQKIDDLIMLSLGTGLNPRYLTSEDGDWGLLQWAPHLISLMLEGSVTAAHYQAKQILDDRYLRISPLLPYPVGLDSYQDIPMLIDIARQVDLTEAQEWVERYFST